MIFVSVYIREDLQNYENDNQPFMVNKHFEVNSCQRLKSKTMQQEEQKNCRKTKN